MELRFPVRPDDDLAAVAGGPRIGVDGGREVDRIGGCVLDGRVLALEIPADEHRAAAGVAARLEARAEEHDLVAEHFDFAARRACALPGRCQRTRAEHPVGGLERHLAAAGGAVGGHMRRRRLQDAPRGLDIDLAAGTLGTLGADAPGAQDIACLNGDATALCAVGLDVAGVDQHIGLYLDRAAFGAARGSHAAGL